MLFQNFKLSHFLTAYFKCIADSFSWHYLLGTSYKKHISLIFSWSSVLAAKGQPGIIWMNTGLPVFISLSLISRVIAVLKIVPYLQAFSTPVNFTQFDILFARKPKNPV
ncbi:hypothetical protein SAMN05192574_105271 [Mucilaginibacter gossypiicola]|uniref:Uncharacterized protein n=1 Tax=Mucilaginibacter gossypiicola TaxID=551995 RepID=A0A1H8LVY2_9SPHI|nr:hypothetical protein SAMN05192574_105271 [Mucilaginibacter gossypiicola]